MKKIMMLALTMGAIVSGQAMAADPIVNYNGSFCDATVGTDIGKINKSFGGLVNVGSAAINVSCPVVMDEVGTTTGTNLITYNVSAATACWFSSMNNDGTTRQLSIASGGPGLVIVPNITTDDNFGSYMMACNLPAGATLRTVTVAEK